VSSIPPQTPDENQRGKRKQISRRLRYEILRRDDHACRYCGVRVPDVVLTIDHVIPVALGGTDDPENLVAACKDCNAGKSANTPDAPLVAQVGDDAIRWLRALEKAAEIAAQEYRDDAAGSERFLELWNRFTYKNYKGESVHVSLPLDWQSKVGYFLRQPGATWGDFEDAVRVAMSNKYVEDEFAYFIGVMNNKMAQRQAIARQMMNNGLA
jgi:hypothetical protein